MNSWSHAFNLWLADYYLSATILLALVLAAGSLIREPVKRMSLAWATLPGLLALALLCDAPFWPRISLVKSNDTAAQPTIKIDSRNAMLERTDLSVSPLQPRQIQFENDQQSATVAVSTALPSTSAARAGRMPLDWNQMLAIAFLAGAAAISVWLAVGNAYSYRLCRCASPAPDMLIQQLQEIAGRTAKLPRLRASWQIQTAAACGLVRPTILLPAGEIERRTPVAYAPGSDGAETNIGRSSAIRALLAHELAHIRRGDLWLLAVSRVLLIPLFVHPLYWLARRRIRADQELIADALAANNCGRHAYAENLLHWARHQPARLQRLAGALGISERPSQLSKRIVMLLDERNRMKVACTRPWHFCIVALATISVISTSIFTLRPIPAARAEAPAREEGSLARRATQRLAKPAAKPTSDQRNDVPQSITITGVCLDENKRPLADVRLHLIEIDYNSRLQNELEELRSDAQGEFHFKPIPYDELDRQRYQLNQLILWVVARLPGKATAIRRLDASAIGAKNELTGFALDRQRTNYGTPADEKLQLTLPPAGTLRGQVKDASGQPVAGAAVSASYPMLKFISGVRNAVTDADGRYEISDLQCWDATKRDAHLEDAGYEAYPTQLYAGASCEGFATQGMLYNQVPGTMDITLHRPAKVEGQVVDSHNMPQAGASVSFTEAGGAATAAAETTDEHGHYSISTLPPGKYRVQTFFAQRPSLIEQEVEIGPVATMHDIQLKAAGTIRGTLVDDATGKPIGTTDPANLSSMITVVYSDPSATSMFFSAADAEGKFSLPAPTGPGYLAIMNPGTQTYREIFEGGRRREYKTVDVKEEETLEIELRVGGELVDRDHGFPMMPRIPYDVPKKAEKADSRKSSSIEAQTEAMAQATPAESKAESKTSTDRTSVDRGVDIVVQRAGGPNKTTNGLPEELGPKIAKLRGVDRVIGGLLDMVSWHDDGVTGALLNGWPAACLLFERLKIQAGRTLAADDNRKIILGTELARQLKKKVGDKVELYGSAEFEVVGVFESPIVFENNGAVVPLAELQSLMNCPGVVTGFSVAAKRPIDEAGLKDLAHRIELFAASQQDASGARLEVDAKPVMDPAQRTAGARPSP